MESVECSFLQQSVLIRCQLIKHSDTFGFFYNNKGSWLEQEKFFFGMFCNGYLDNCHIKTSEIGI